MILKRHNRDVSLRYEPFSQFWWTIAQTRFALCAIIFIFTLYNPNINSPRRIYFVLGGYVIFQFFLGFVSSDTLKSVAVRVVPSFVDVLFISVIVHFTGGPSSTWFVIYVFPIISVSKYLEYKGSLLLALSTITGYATVIYFLPSSQGIDLRTFLFRCLFFLATALLGGNLARTKRKEERKLIEVFEEINDEILSDISSKKAFRMILRQALEMTRSEMGHIRVISQNGHSDEPKIVAAIGHPKYYNWDLRPLDDSISRLVTISKRPLKIPSIRKRDLKRFLGTYFKLHHPRPKSALFVPLLIKGRVNAVLAVYSRKRYHYIKRSGTRLGGLAPLMAVAVKTAEFNKELNLALEENRKRLDLLYEIGGQLRAGLPLNDLFQKVVELIYVHLDSEEAALFTPDEHSDARIKKVAVKGPTEAITLALESVELAYTKGQSLTGKIFETHRHIFLKEVDRIEEYVDEYTKILPSNKILHYVGVPLMIGNEFLGVIRVINKKAPDYSARDNPKLSEVGFDKTEDVGLLKTIAIQVAVAIKYTKLLESEKLAAIGNVAKSVGHEIKTNLATALNYVAGLKAGCDPKEDGETFEIYTDIQDALWEARNHIQNMLMAARPKDMQQIIVEISDIFYEFEDKLRREAEAANIGFSVDYPADNSEFLVDVSQIRQVFANLFNNSIYAIQEKMTPGSSFKGFIKVSARFKEDSLQICWKDNGVGVSRQDLPNLFRPFFTKKVSAGSPKKDAAGSGLGLFISKTIVENHNGDISVTSEENEGTTFTITLPLSRNKAIGEGND